MISSDFNTSEFFGLQLNRTSFSAVSTNAFSKSYNSIIQDQKCRGLCFVTRAQSSVEGSVLEKERASEPGDKIGECSYYLHNYIGIFFAW